MDTQTRAHNLMWEECNKHNKQIDMAEWNDRESQGGRDMKVR